MRTVYAIVNMRTIKHITGARAGQVSHNGEFRHVWNEKTKRFEEGFDTMEEAVFYLDQKKKGYLEGENSWKLVTDSIIPGAFAVKCEWGKSAKGETIDSWNIVPLVIED